MSQVRDIMQKKVITIELQRTVQDAAVMLKEKHISFVVVVKDSKPVGVIFRKRYRKKSSSREYQFKINTTRSNYVKKFQMGRTKCINRVSSSKNVKQQH